MKSYFSRFLVGLGAVLVALFALDEIFLFLREAHLLPMYIEEKVVIYLTMTPFLAVLLYSMLSVFAKTKSFKQVIIAGGVGVLLAIAEVAAFFISSLSAYYMFGAALIIAAIVLTIYGFGAAESSGSYGVLCANAVYFTFKQYYFGHVCFKRLKSTLGSYSSAGIMRSYYCRYGFRFKNRKIKIDIAGSKVI